MSANAIKDSGDALPLNRLDYSEDPPKLAAGRKAAIAEPKARTKRQRPTFDDGSITRVFKFPSRSYPRSSYYVTSTEIVIRIKKARKRWKLVVPKKRVASYRTNRWFAKPRWVEIELTYTQASRLGLVETRTASKDVSSGKPAEQPVAEDAIVESECILLEDSTSESDPDGTATRQTICELDPDGDRLGLSAHNDSRTPLLQTLPEAGADACSGQPMSAVAASRRRTDQRTRRSNAFLVMASLALLSAGVAAAWMTLSDFSTEPTRVSTACAHSEHSASCAQAIVTGAISKTDPSQSPEHSSPSASETQVTPEPSAAVEPLQLGAAQVPKAAIEPAEHIAGAGKARSLTDDESERTALATANASLDATSPKSALPPPQTASLGRQDCRELRAVGQAINIQFDYASADLTQAALAALEAFAVRLRSCPSVKVTIEGHTDSDGSAARNQALSIHRAKAVRERLVHAGAKPSQLSTIGFGQSHPYAPNVSTENKRSNRRVAFVVALPR